MNTTGEVQSPEVLVEPNDTADVVFVAPGGIYIDHSVSPTSLQHGWGDQPTELVPFQHPDASGFPFDYLPLAGKESMERIPYYPSTAIGRVGTDNYLYAAYMDGNLSGDSNQPDGTHGIYFLQYDLTNPQPLPLTPGRVAQDPSVTDQWMPSLALSPDGSYAFIGFYGGSGFYNSDNGMYDEHYNTYYIAGATNAGGPNWGNPTQITNVDGSGQPTGGYFDQPGGPSTDDLQYNPASIWLPDYDGASADYQNFHYSFMETSNEVVHDSSGNPVTLDAQSDVYMANIPVPYTDTAPTAPTVDSFTPSMNQGSLTLTVRWSGNFSSFPNAFAYVEYSADGKGWLPFGSNGTPAANDFLRLLGNDPTFPNYSQNTTYYFRVRVQGASGLGRASSAWSTVYVAPGSNTMVFTATSANDTIVLREDNDGQNIDFTLNNAQPIKVPIISGGSLLVLGGGGSDQITFDLSNGNFLAAAGNTIDNDTGSMNLEIVGTSSNDTVSMVGGGNAPYQFDGTYVNVVAGLLDSLEYGDGGGNDTINVSGYFPAMLNLSTSNSTITNSDSNHVYIVPGTGKINLTATAGRTIFLASAATTGVRQINFIAINISAGAAVVLANSSAALGDYSNHDNRSVAVVDAGGLNIAAGGTLDLGDNDMIFYYDPADEAAAKSLITNLAVSGYGANKDFSGTGLTSSEAYYDATQSSGTRAVGWADNADLGKTSFDGVTLANANEMLVKFTYYGDSDLDGIVDTGPDLSLFAKGFNGTGSGWDFGDYNYDGATNNLDLSLFARGLDSGYDKYGQL